MRDRVAEVHEHAVAEILRDRAFEARDALSRGLLKAAHRLAPVLGSERGRELGRSDEIREDDRELAVLRFRAALEPASALVAEARLGRIARVTPRTLHAS